MILETADLTLLVCACCSAAKGLAYQEKLVQVLH